MATNPIDYFTAVYGVPPWTTISLSWDGTATDYTLFEADSSVSLINGPFKTYEYEGQPDTRYDFRLETETITGTRALALTAYTASLPAPSGRAASDVTSTSVQLSWQPVLGATSYEIANVATDYSVISTTASTSVSITGLVPRTRNSFAVRTVLGSVRSPWSSPLTVTTSDSGLVTAGVYTFAPTGIAVWREGRPGSTTPSWRPTADDYYHGDGWVWGDASGQQTTYMFYGSPNPFLSIVGGGITKLEVYADRAVSGGDPGTVLSHWSLHSYPSKPAGEPTPNDSEYDAGLLARGEAAWLELPVSWAQSLITNGSHKGIAWGGVPDRYQVSTNFPTPAPPVFGTLRFTVA
jgi:hypothetical protein